MIIKETKFIKSASQLSHLPDPGIPEFAFIGRSNVGKSSLMNMLLNRKNLVKTSKKPGKTVLLNYFLINQSFYFVDLPGYGFAARSKTDQEAWRKTIEKYLRIRESLVDIFLLIDARHNIQKNDEEMMSFLDYFKLDYTLVYTKIDKIPKNKRSALFKEKEKNLFVSAISKEGKEEMWEYIESCLSF